MNDSNESCENRLEVVVSTSVSAPVSSSVSTSSPKTRNKKPKRPPTRTSKRMKSQPKVNTSLSTSDPTMGSLLSLENASNEENTQMNETTEETQVSNENQNEVNSGQTRTQTTETNVSNNVCIDLTEDDSVVDENNAESDPEIQCISTVVRDTDLCIVRDIKRRKRLTRKETPSQSADQSADQSDDVIEIQDSQTFSSNESKSVTEKTPNKKSIKCPVCLEEYSMFGVSGKQLVSTNCGHLFCDHCIKEIVKTSKSCPNCRKKITVRGFHPIYI